MPCNSNLKMTKQVSMDYCPNCRRRTEHIKDAKNTLCKRCGRQEKRIILV